MVEEGQAAMLECPYNSALAQNVTEVTWSKLPLDGEVYETFFIFADGVRSVSTKYKERLRFATDMTSARPADYLKLSLQNVGIVDRGSYKCSMLFYNWQYNNQYVQLDVRGELVNHLCITCCRFTIRHVKLPILTRPIGKGPPFTPFLSP